MQNIISSNMKSITNSKFQELGKITPFAANEQSFPDLGIQYHKVSPYINILGNVHNNSITFKLPAGAGFLYEASIGFLCTYVIDADDNVHAPIAMNMVRSIEWLSNGVPIVYKTGHAIYAQIKSWKEPTFQKFALRYAKMLVNNTEDVAAAGPGPFLTYLPLVESFLTHIEKSLLLNKIADLQLRVTFTSADESGLKTANGVTALTATLYCQTYMPKLSTYQEMVTADWSKTLPMEGINTYTEVAALVDATNAKYTLTVPFLVFKSHFMVRGIVPVNGFGIRNFRIKSFTFNLGGQVFTDKLLTSRLNSCAAKYGTGNTNVGANDALTFDNDVLTVDWGILCGRGANTGTAFFQELQGSNVEIEFDTVTTAANARLFVVHETYNVINYEPSSGGGILSISSNS
jgi:hypothetical protein